MPKRYLTKSRFKLAVECPTKLYYAGKENEYKNNMQDDTFLQMLEVVDKMTLEEKKMYCQALIERVDVYPWDPTEKEKSPPKKISKEGLLNPEPKLKTKNKWYRLKIRYRELPDVSTSSGGGGSSLGLHRLGSANTIQTQKRS